MVSDTAQKKSNKASPGKPGGWIFRHFTRGFGWVLLAALILAGLGYVSALEHLRLRTVAELNSQARMAAGVLDACDPASRPRQMRVLGEAAGRSLQLLDPDGKLLAESALPGAAAGRVSGEAPMTHPPGTLRVTLPDDRYDLARTSLRNRFLGVTAAGLVVLALLLARVSSSWSSTLGEMEETARRLGRGDIRRHMPLPENPVFHPLTESLNEMADQLFLQIQTVVRQRNQLQTLLESMSDGLLSCDDEERILDLNRTAAAWLGADAGTARGRKVHEICRNSGLQEILRQVLETGASRERDIQLAAGTGAERLLQVRGTMLNRLEGRRGVLLILQDVTHLRRLENMRRDFAANVGHELRTPVTSIKGYAETLLDGALADPAEARHMTEIILKQADRLMAVFDDLLQLSRIEQQDGQHAIALAPADVRPVLASAVEQCSRQAGKLGLRMELACPAGLRANLHPVLLEQAVSNLLDNAIKYGGTSGTVRVAARREGAHLVISVSDQGPGIDRRHFDRLFERFYRVDRARSRAVGGTGLGLAIVKHIAQAHHGNVGVESTLGAGTTFTITLPALEEPGA
ncbi:MAG: ATP-binding protein [Kiritimatiellia bacterium]